MNYIKFYLVIIKILSFINVLNIQIIFGHISIQKNETFENIFNRNGQLFFPKLPIFPRFFILYNLISIF